MMPRVYRRTPACRTPFEALHEMAVNFAVEEFGRKGEVPFLWLIDIGDESLWMETPWENDREKDAYVKLMKVLMRESRARAYAQIVEAWVSTTVGTDDDFIPPSQRPKNERDDIMMVMSSNRSGAHLQTRCLVTIRKRGLNFLGPRMDDPMGDTMTGRMSNLLADPQCSLCGLILGHKDGCIAQGMTQFFKASEVRATNDK